MFEYNIMPLYATPSPSPTSHGDSDAFMASTSACYSSPDNLQTNTDFVTSSFPPKVAKMNLHIWKAHDKFFHVRPVVASMGVQKCMGLAPQVSSGQDGEPFTRRTNSYWGKLRWPPITSTSSVQPSQSPAVHIEGLHEAAVAFFMDAVLGWIPLSFASRSIADVSACASLDISLRFLRPPDFNGWMLMEQTTEAGTGGRTFSMGKLWDMQGRLVADMTQVHIMRPWPEKDCNTGAVTKL